jgi:hypothetical protein
MRGVACGPELLQLFEIESAAVAMRELLLTG